MGLTPCDITIEAEKLPAKGGRIRLLLDKPEKTLGFKGSKDKYEKYPARLEDYKEVQKLSPIFSFYDKPEEIEKALKAFSSLSPAKQKGSMTFAINSTLLVSLRCVRDAVKKEYEGTLCSKKQEGLCAICGTNTYLILDEPHGPVRLPKGQTLDNVLVSYNNNAFESYNLKGNLNSGICTNCARNYIRGLQYLVGNGHEITTEKGGKIFRLSDRQKVSGDTTTSFWTKGPNEDTDPFSDICQPTEERIGKLFSLIAAEEYQRVDAEVENYFYSYTISSAAAHIAVRDWMTISISQYQKNLEQWFDDIETVKDGEISYPGVNSILNSCIKKKTKQTQSDAKAKARMGVILWHAALTNTFLPLMVLRDILNQIEHEKTTEFNKTFSVEKSTVIRLVLNRNIRNTYYMNKELDEQNENKAYLYGRLFAFICKLRFKA